MLHKKFLHSLLAALILTLAPQAQAGLLDHFKNLVDQTGTAIENYNQNMWTGEASLGKTAIKSVKGAFAQEGVGNKVKGLNAAVDTIVAAQVKAQDGALADVKTILNTLKEIALYLPKKLNELFMKAMGKIKAFIARLNELNESHLGVGGGGEGGGAAAAAAPMADFGGDDELASALDAPSAPRASQSLPELDGAFSTMLESVSGLDSKKRSHSQQTIRASYLKALEMAFQSNSRDAAKELWAEAPAVFQTAPQEMQKSIEKLAASSGSDLAKQFAKAGSRLARSAQVQAKVK